MTALAIEPEVLAALVRVLAPALAAELRPLLSKPAHPEFADARNNPLGSARAFLDAHRRGEFRTFRVNRQITARWEDVIAAVQMRPACKASESALIQPTAAGPEIDPSTLLDDAVAARRPRKARSA